MPKSCKLSKTCWPNKEPDLSAEPSAMIERRRNLPGILIGSIGPHDNILKLRPPMVFGREHADFFLGVLDDVLGTTE